MSLSTLVKISGVNNLSDARYCAGMGAAILGFCPEPNHPYYVDLKKFKEITGWIKGVKLAGEFYKSSIEEILQFDRDYCFDFLEIRNFEMVTRLSDYKKPLIFNISLNEINDMAVLREILERLSFRITYFLFEGKSPYPETMKEIFLLSKDFPILLGAGINPGNISALNQQYRFSGFALRAGIEIKPGYGDFDDLAQIFELLETG